MGFINKLENVMHDAVDRCEIAGVSLLVEKNGKELCYCESGMADIEQQMPIQRDTIFRLFSQTKPVTAAAVMILVERGLLDLCQPVADFLPAYKSQKVYDVNGIRPVMTPMRVFDLMQMTSGLVYPDATTISGQQVGAVFMEIEQRLFTDHTVTTGEVANMLASCALAFEPGSSWQYGTSADVLGAIIEVVSGMSFAQFLRKELFDPLGMEDTDFWVPREKQNRLAAAYETVMTGSGVPYLLRYTENHLAIRNDMAEEPAFASGGAGLVSTLDDYMRFARMLLNGGEAGGVRILHPGTVRYLTSGGLTGKQKQAFDVWANLEGYSYGNLMRVNKEPNCAGYLTKCGEYGWDGWMGTYFANFPQENLTILIGAQRKAGGFLSISRKLRNIILSSL